MNVRAVLIGPPGAGKTSVGTALARAWGVAFRDTDVDVERGAGMSVADIFVTQSEAAFRELERDALVKALQEHDGVLSVGGGAPLHPLSQDDLRSYAAGGGTVVFLDVSLAAVAPRVGLNASRPLLVGNPRQQWLALMKDRRPVYESLATVTVLTDDLTPDQVAQQIMEKNA